jgi:hypothetical protein
MSRKQRIADLRRELAEALRAKHDRDAKARKERTQVLWRMFGAKSAEEVRRFGQFMAAQGIRDMKP